MVQMVNDRSISFYNMASSKEFHPGTLPNDPNRVVEGLRQAIESTERRMARDGSTSDLESHPENLKRRLAEAQNKNQ